MEKQPSKSNGKIREQVSALIDEYAREISECAEDEGEPSLINRAMLSALLSLAYDAPPRRQLSYFEDSVMLVRGQIKKWLEIAQDPKNATCSLFKKLFQKMRTKRFSVLDEIVSNQAHIDPAFALQLQKQVEPHVYGAQVVEKHEVKEIKATVHTIREIRLQLGQYAEQLRELGFNADGSRIAASEALTVDGAVFPSGEGESPSGVSTVAETANLP